MRCFPMLPKRPEPNKPFYSGAEVLELTAVLLCTAAFWYAASMLAPLFHF